MDNNKEEMDTELEKTNIDNENFNGYFHERDSLSENNIVDEVKSSFLEYSMSVIASRVFFGTLFMVLCFVLAVLMNRQFQMKKSDLATGAQPAAVATPQQPEQPEQPTPAPTINLEQFDTTAKPAEAPAVEPAPAETPAVEPAPAAEPAPAPEPAPAQ